MAFLVRGRKKAFPFISVWASKAVYHSSVGCALTYKITLSDWLYNAVEGFEVLTLHRDYFRLRKPMERRIYELARKRANWRI